MVIPAHDEEAVIARGLRALLDGAVHAELEIVVVCNGCSDRTAEIARGFGPEVVVIETAVPSKTHALNLGDAAATYFPRLYVDADVVLPLASARLVVESLRRPGALASAPSMDTDVAGASWPVRAFYAVWSRLPYVREGMVGVGVFGLSRAGRQRFGRFPDVIADDGYVRAHFAAGERVRVDGAPVRVVAPATLADLVRVKTRSRLGGMELERKFPGLMDRERRAKSYAGAVAGVARRPSLWLAAVVYLVVNRCARFRARRQDEHGRAVRWERDLSSRRGV